MELEIGGGRGAEWLDLRLHLVWSKLGKSPDCVLSVAEKPVCLWWLPPRRSRVRQLKNGLICLKQAYWFQTLTAGYFVRRIPVFDLWRWVGLCGVFSLVCGVSALPLQRQDVISVMSGHGFIASY